MSTGSCLEQSVNCKGMEKWASAREIYSPLGQHAKMHGHFGFLMQGLKR